MERAVPAAPFGVDLSLLSVAALVIGFAYAAVVDLREREASDRLWQAMGLVGLGVGVAVAAPGGLVPMVLWVVVGLLVLEHVFPWDLALGGWWDRHAGVVEVTGYVASVSVVAAAVGYFGLGVAGVPWAVVVVLVVVLFARGLFELGVLYGGADVKALMIAGLLVPTFAAPVLLGGGGPFAAIAYLPFAVSLLTNAALFSLAVPLAIAFHNLRRGEFEFPDGFTGYTLPVAELPRRFVWVRDPAVPESDDEDDAETSAEDTARRTHLAQLLAARGLRRVRVSPQVPFLTLMAFGAIAALLAGNLLLDLIVRL